MTRQTMTHRYVAPPRCVKCGTTGEKLMRCEDAPICDPCLDTICHGKDETTHAAKQALFPKRKATYAPDGTLVPSVPALGMAQVVADATAHRLSLLTPLGVDCVASAMEAEQAIGPRDSLEGMLAHQMAAVHTAAMQALDKAFFRDEPEARAKLLNAAARLLETYQRGLLTLHRIRSDGVQNIHVHHVHVGEGGQAIVGSVHGPGGSAK